MLFKTLLSYPRDRPLFAVALFILGAFFIIFSALCFVEISAVTTGTVVSCATLLIYLGLYERGYNRVIKATDDEEDFLESSGARLQRFWSNSREQSMITMGSLFVPTSFVLLGVASQPSIMPIDRLALSLLAPILYGVWLFTIQLSTRLMNDTDAQLQQLARDPRGDFARLQNRLYGDRHGKGWMMRARRNHWLLYLPILIYGSSFLILQH